MIGKLISPTQSAFTLGRWIAENGLLVQDIVHSSSKKKTGVGGLMGVKLDMQKAYDQVQWGSAQNFGIVWLWQPIVRRAENAGPMAGLMQRLLHKED